MAEYINTKFQEKTPKLHCLTSDEADDFYIRSAISGNYGVYRFKNCHDLAGTAMIAKPRNNTDKTLVIRKHTDLFFNENCRKEFNNLFALFTTGKLHTAYFEPGEDESDEGENIESFYTEEEINVENTIADELLRKRVFSVAQIVSIVRQLLEQIEQLQECKLVHGGIRPQNVALEWHKSKPVVYLLNYAMTLGNDHPRKAPIDNLSRTPESVAQFEPLSTASDMYCLGVLTVTLLTGKCIFSDVSDLALLRQMIVYGGVKRDDVANTPFIRKLFDNDEPISTDRTYSRQLRELIKCNLGGTRYESSTNDIENLIHFAESSMKFIPNSRQTIAEAFASLPVDIDGRSCTQQRPNWTHSTANIEEKLYPLFNLNSTDSENDEYFDELRKGMYEMVKLSKFKVVFERPPREVRTAVCAGKARMSKEMIDSIGSSFDENVNPDMPAAQLIPCEFILALYSDMAHISETVIDSFGSGCDEPVDPHMLTVPLVPCTADDSNRISELKRSFSDEGITSRGQMQAAKISRGHKNMSRSVDRIKCQQRKAYSVELPVVTNSCRKKRKIGSSVQHWQNQSCPEFGPCTPKRRRRNIFE